MKGGGSQASSLSGPNEDLIDAVKNGDVEAVKSALNAGANVDAADKDGRTALHLASFEGHLGVVTALFAAKADVNAKDNNDVTALRYASTEGHTGVVEALLAAKADVNAKEKLFGSTALHYASGNGDIGIVNALLAAKIEVNATGDEGKTALHTASYWGQFEVVKLLIAAGADVDASDKYGDTALMTASEKGHDDIVKLLLDSGAKVNTANKDNLTTSELRAITRINNIDAIRKEQQKEEARIKTKERRERKIREREIRSAETRQQMKIQKEKEEKERIAREETQRQKKEAKTATDAQAAAEKAFWDPILKKNRDAANRRAKYIEERNKLAIEEEKRINTYNKTRKQNKKQNNRKGYTKEELLNLTPAEKNQEIQKARVVSLSSSVLPNPVNPNARQKALLSRNPNAGASVIGTEASEDIYTEPTKHSNQRSEDRNVSKHQQQQAIKYGKQKPSSTNPNTFFSTHKDVTVFRSKENPSKIVTTWKNSPKNPEKQESPVPPDVQKNLTEKQAEYQKKIEGSSQQLNPNAREFAPLSERQKEKQPMKQNLPDEGPSQPYIPSSDSDDGDEQLHEALNRSRIEQGGKKKTKKRKSKKTKKPKKTKKSKRIKRKTRKNKKK